MAYVNGTGGRPLFKVKSLFSADAKNTIDSNLSVEKNSTGYFVFFFFFSAKEMQEQQLFCL